MKAIAFTIVFLRLPRNLQGQQPVARLLPLRVDIAKILLND
jgi:hypothetical protein